MESIDKWDLCYLELKESYKDILQLMKTRYIPILQKQRTIVVGEFSLAMDISILSWELDIIGNVGNFKVSRKIWLPTIALCGWSQKNCCLLTMVCLERV